MRNEETLIVVLSRSYSTGLSVIRSLGMAGYTVDLVASAYKEGQSASIASSKYVHNYVEVVSKKIKDGGDSELVEQLLQYAGKYEEKPVLFPTDDYTTSIMDLNRNVLEDIFVMPGIVGGKEGSLKHCMDKSVQGEIARKVGILTPQEWVVSLRNEEIIVPEDMVYPCYCKPLESSRGYKWEMAKCDDKDELINHLYKLREAYPERSILVQQFLDIDEEIDLEGVCLDQEIILPAIIWKRIIAQYYKGVPLAGKTFPVEELGEFQEKIISLLREFHYFGMFDLGLNIVDGKIYFNEINMRSGGTNFVYFKSGVNLPALFVKAALGQERTPEEEKITEYGKTYLYEKVAWEDYFHDILTKEAVEECMKTADITIMCNDDDPVPGNLYMEEITKRVHEKQKREERLSSVMENSGWNREYAEQQIKSARERLGISLKDYEKNSFWKYSEKEQEEEYKKILERREKNRKQQKEDAITSAMIADDWERKYAEQQIVNAKQRTGISYRDYVKYGFWNYSEDKQEEEYKKILEKKENRRQRSVQQKDSKPLVIVLSRNPSAGLGVIRSLGADGYPVDLVASAYKEGRSAIAAGSKYVHHSVEIVSKNVKNGEDIMLLRELLRYAGKYEKKPVLFPTDDYSVSVMDLNRNILAPHFVMPSIASGGTGSLTEYMNQIVQGEMAREAGLLTPQEWIFSLKEEIVIPDEMVYPCSCKPIESADAYKKKVVVCNNEAELKSYLNRLRRTLDKGLVLVRELLDIDNEIDISGVCLDQKIIIPAIIRKTNIAQYDKNVTLAGKIVPFEEMGEVQENIINMMKKFHYIGMFDIEFSLVGDKIYFNEVNLRSGRPNYSYYMSGVNLPALFVKEAVGEQHAPEEEQVNEYGKTFIYEKAAWKDYINGFMSKKELDDCIEAADITLLCNEDDPVPGEIFTRNIKKSAVRRRLRNIKKRVAGVVKPVLRKIKHFVLGYPQTKRKNRRDPNSEKPRVLVAGRNYCSNLCMARSLGKVGYEVEILRVFQVRPKRRRLLKQLKPDAYSKYVKAYYVCVSGKKSSRIVNRLKAIADPEHKMLLIPVDDLVAYVIDDYYDELKEFYLMPNVDDKAGEINRLMSKGVQKDLAIQAGLPVVNSCIIRTENGKFEIPEDVSYPCFIKPNISKNSYKTKMRKCGSEEELRNALTELSEKKDIEMLVEDFVEIGREYSLLGLSTKDGVVGPGFFGAVVGGQAEHRGVAMIGEILPCSQMQSLVDDLIRFIGTLKYDGLYDVDLIETVDGKVYFVELNLRFGGSGYAVTESGVNLPAMFADYMIYQKPVDMDCKIQNTGKKFVSEKVLIDEYAMGRIPMSVVRSSMKEVDIHFVKDDQDKHPYRHFRRYYLIAAIRRVLCKARDYMNKESVK